MILNFLFRNGSIIYSDEWRENVLDLMRRIDNLDKRR